MNAKIIAMSNQKGGAGKTTTSINLAAALEKEGKKVLCIDCDPQGNLAVGLGINFPDELEYTMAELMLDVINERQPKWDKVILNHNGIDYIPSNVALEDVETLLVTTMAREYVLRNIVRDLRELYDYIILDSRPSLGMLTMNALTACDYVLIPYAADIYGAKGMEQLLSRIFKVRKYLNLNIQIMGILLTADDGTNLTNDVQELIKDTYGEYIKIFDVRIPKTVAVKEAASKGKTVFEYKKLKNKAVLNNVRCAYEQLGKEVEAYASR